MSTGAAYANITAKKLLGYDDFSTRILGYMRNYAREATERAFNTDGVFETPLAMSGDSSDRFKITGGPLATDGDGHILNIANAYNSGVYFQNSLGIQYYVGLKYTEKPSGIIINPRTGLPDFLEMQETVGEKAPPTSVTDNGNGTLTFNVDSVCEAGITNAGRQVLVYKKIPVKNATTVAIAMETCTVVWAGSQNRITTTAQFGQDTASTTAADYEVILLGPTVKRNTDLRSTSGYTFIGIITGAGAGSTPSTFNHLDQTPIQVTLSQFAEITRTDSHGFLKVHVKADSLDSGEHQIRVSNYAGTTKFSVDEAGNVVVGGNLTVQGTTTQQNVVQVNSSETITDNLTAGDAATDSHLIKGSWFHKNAAGSSTFFNVDGTTGRVGIGGVQDGAHALKVTGDVDITGTINAANGVDGNWNPSAHNTRDLGLTGTRWRSLYLGTDAWVSGRVSSGQLSVDSSVANGIASDLLPPTASTDTYSIGASGRRFLNGYFKTINLDTTAGFGVGTHLAPTANGTLTLGTSSRRWATLYVSNINVSGDFLPAVDNSQDIGTLTGPLRWRSGYFGTNLQVDGNVGIGVAPSASLYLYLAKTSGTVTSNAVGIYSSMNFTDPDAFDKLATAGDATDSHATGTINAVFGHRSTASKSGAGITTSLYGGAFNRSITGGTVTSTYGVSIGSLAAGGTTTNNYGLYVEAQSGAANNYAIYTNQGIVRFGDFFVATKDMPASGAWEYAHSFNANKVADASAAMNALFVTATATNTSGSIGSIFALRAEATADGNAGGTVGTGSAIYTITTANNKAFTTAISANIGSNRVLGSGSIANNYGVYVENQTVGVSANYAIWTNAGNVRFGGAVMADSGSILNRGAAGSYRLFECHTGTTPRWSFGADTSSESGSNAGSNFALWNYPDGGGAPIAQLLSITRSTGLATWAPITGATGAAAIAWRVNGTFNAADSGMQRIAVGCYPATTHATGNIGSLYGLETNPAHTGAGTLTYLVGAHIYRTTGAGSGLVGDSWGVTIKAPQHAVAPTNNIGLRIEDQTGGVSTNYSIYTMLGKIRFGDTIDSTGPTLTTGTPALNVSYAHGASGGADTFGINIYANKSASSGASDRLYNVNSSLNYTANASASTLAAFSTTMQTNHTSGTVGVMYGYQTYFAKTGAGTVSELKHFGAIDPGGQAATTSVQYGLHLTAMTSATTNYAVYTAGTTQSRFGGNVGVGSDFVPSVIETYLAAPRYLTVTPGTNYGPALLRLGGSTTALGNGVLQIGASGSFLSGEGNVWQTVLGANLVSQFNGTSAVYVTPATRTEGYRALAFSYTGSLVFFNQVANTTAGATVTPTMRMSINNTGGVCIGNFENGLSLLTVGGQAGGSMYGRGLAVYDVAALGTTASNRLLIASFGASSTSASHLGITAYRFANGSDWTTCGMRLGYNVDSTLDVGFVEIRNNGFWTSGSALSLGTGDLGSGSFRWNTLFNASIDCTGFASIGNYLNLAAIAAPAAATGRIYTPNTAELPLQMYHQLHQSTAQWRNVGEVQYTVTYISTATMNGGGTITLVAGQGAGVQLFPIKVMIQRLYNTALATFTAVPQVYCQGFQWSTGATTTTGWNNGLYDEWYSWQPDITAVNGSSGSIVANGGIYLGAQAATGGDSEYYCHCWYVVMRIY